MPEAAQWLGLILLGVAVGAYGTVIGAGGGFVLVPVLLLIYPEDSTALLTSISLAVVFFNALSGTAAYAAQRRVDGLAAAAFALATLPGAVAGALAVSLVPRRAFDAVFAGLLLVVGAVLTLPLRAPVVQRRTRRGEVTRRITDAQGNTFVYSYNLAAGLAVSAAVGFFSSVLGVGGGIIHVPAMILLLHFPAHVATATSQAVLTASALAGTVTHLVRGDLDGGYLRVALLAIGVLGGAQLGARLSLRLGGRSITRLLALALLVVAVRLALAAAGL